MAIVIVPDSLDRAITEKLDAAFVECPDAEKDREILHQQLLDYFYEHGVLPDFMLARKENAPAED